MYLKGMQQEGKLCTCLSLSWELQGLQSSTEMGLWCWLVFLSLVTTAGEASSKAVPAALVAVVFSRAVLGGPMPSVCLGQKHMCLCNRCSMSVRFSYPTGGETIYTPCPPSCYFASQTLPAPISLCAWCGAQIWGPECGPGVAGETQHVQLCSVALSRNESLGGFI